MRRAWIAIALLLAACPPSREPEGTAAGPVVATWRGGEIGLGELEERVAAARTDACLDARRSAGGGSLEELLPCYREVAEGLALERLILAGVPDPDQAIEALGPVYEQLRRQSLMAPFMQRLSQEVEITDAEIEAEFEQNRDRYRQRGRLILFNIFRRHEDPERPEETLELLAGVKGRFLAGETFDALAREVSHSETRMRGGRVGMLRAGILPGRLEKLAFALEEGGISDPIPVAGGAVLLHVRNVVEAAERTLGEVREEIRQQLAAQRVQERLAARVDGLEPAAGSTVLGDGELAAALDAGDAERVVLQIAGLPAVSAGSLRQIAGIAEGERAADLDEAGRERLAGTYRTLRDRQLLLADLADSADADPDERRAAEEWLREAALARVVDERLREEMWRLIDAEPERVRRYWEDNRHHYQSPVRYKVSIWSLPFDDDPPAQARRMEAMRDRLAAGEIDLAAAAGSLGGSVEDHGWQEYGELLGRLPASAANYLLEIGDGGFTVPYRLGPALHMIWLEERAEPRPLDYEEARDQVREDYFARFQGQLYRRVLEARLEAADFAFDAEAVRGALEPPS